jgi:ribonucleoside-diphosphate reductase beta chain
MLFEEQVARKPNLYPWTQHYIDSIWGSFWTPNEFNFTSDKKQFWTELTSEQRGVVVRTLSAIGQIEIAVKTFWAKLGENFRHPGLVDLGFVMAQNEVIHNQAYEKLLEVLDLTEAFAENLKNPVVAARVAYLRKYTTRRYDDDRKQYVYALALFTLFVENISLFSQFAIILHIHRHHNVLKDTAQQVQYTRLEEQLHAQVGIRLINTLREEYPELFDENLEARILEEAQEALRAEGNVIDWIMNGYSEPNLNADLLRKFIHNRMSDSLTAIGFKSFPRHDLPEMHWMDEESLGASRTDFFHQRPVEYGKKTQSFDRASIFGNLKS